MSEIKTQEDLIAELARIEGWTPKEIEHVLQHVQAPLEGFRHSIVAANMLRSMGREARRLYEYAMYERDPYTGTPMGGTSRQVGKLHEAVQDFIGDEGKERRKEARAYAKEFRACLAESRRHYAQAAYFQGMLGESELLSAKRVEPEEETEEEAEDRARADELAARINRVAAKAVSELNKTSATKVKKEAKAGLKGVKEDLREAAEVFDGANT